MNLNPSALLTLISDLCTQIMRLTQENEELKRQLAEVPKPEPAK